MKIKDAIHYMEANKLVLKSIVVCDRCSKQSKTIYELVCPDYTYDDAYFCGKCLVKVAESWKEHCEGGGSDYEYTETK